LVLGERADRHVAVRCLQLVDALQVVLDRLAEIHAGTTAPRAVSASIAARPASPMSTLNSLTYSSMCCRHTSGDISCECSATYEALASGCANAYSTDARIAASTASRSATPSRAQIVASGTGREVDASHSSPRSAMCTSPWSAYVNRLSW